MRLAHIPWGNSHRWQPPCNISPICLSPHNATHTHQYNHPTKQGKNPHNDKCFLPCKECYQRGDFEQWVCATTIVGFTKDVGIGGFFDKDIFVLDTIAIQLNVPAVYHVGLGSSNNHCLRNKYSTRGLPHRQRHIFMTQITLYVFIINLLA